MPADDPADDPADADTTSADAPATESDTDVDAAAPGHWDADRTRLRPPNIGAEPAAKLGTFTPQRIYVPESELPLTEGQMLRFAETDPREFHPTHGAPLSSGLVEEIREEGPESLLFIRRC